jgi:hypothetical protein
MDRTAFRRHLGERALRLPIWFHVAINLAAALVPLYWWITFSGLFRVWAEYEREADGKYSAEFIYVMLVCVLTLTAAVVTQVVAGLRPPATEDQKIERGVWFKRYEDADIWLRRHSFKLKLVAIAVGAAVAGVSVLLTRN